MQIINKDLGSYNLHIIKTDQFKTMTMQVIFHTPIIKKDITKRNILSDILLQSTKEYTSHRDLTIKSEELYGADLYTRNRRVGNYIMTSFTIQTLNDKYTEEEKNLKNQLNFFMKYYLTQMLKTEGSKKIN